MRFSVKIVALFIITILFISNTFAQQIPLYKKDVPLYIEEIEIKGTDHVFSVVEEIVQTKDGNIWLATNHGLWNYNGIDFTAYNITTHPNHFIINENSNSILEGDDSTLWVGTRNGLIMIKNNVFSRYGDSLLNESTIVRMCKDDKGNIYLGTLRRGLFRINPDKSLYKYEKPSLENNVIFSLFYSDSTLWIGTSEDGVIKLKDEKFEYLKNISPHFSYEMRDIHKDKDGNYWFGSSKNGLIKYFNNKLQHYTLKDGLSSDRIYAIAESADGSLFFGSFGGGLIKLEKNQFTSYDMNNGLSIDAVRSLYYDKEGNLWIGLLGGGLNVLRQKNLLTYNMRQKLSDSYIWTVNKDLSGNIWIGTNASGVNVVTKNKLQYLNETFHPNCVNIRTITNDSKGRTWIGTINRGIILVDNDKKTIFSKANGFVNDTILSIYEDSKGAIWIGSWGPLTIYKNGKIEFPKFHNDTILRRVNFIKEDFEHNYWFATIYGILKYSKNKITYYSTKDGLSTNRTYSFFVHEDSSILVCTGQGLYRYKNEKFSHINFGNIFNTSLLREILEDDFSNYWVSSVNGIITFKKEDLNKFINREIDVIPNRIIGKEDGMLTPECSGGNQNACAKGLDGRLWFATTNGVVVLDPEKIIKEINDTPPNIFINRLIANDSLININNDKIEIPADSRNIQIFYSALSYKNPLLNKYKYRLVGSGSNNEWIEAGNMSMARYSTLPYGKYTFEVIGSNSDLVWNKIGAQLTFTVLPKFYQKTSFIIFASLSTLLLLYLIYKFRVKSLERNKIRLQTIVAQQTAALQYEIEQRKLNEEKLLKMRKVESLSLLAGGIAHDFNNLLTAILGNISLLKYKLQPNDTNNLTKLLENTEAASLRAKGLTQQLLTFSKEGKPVIKSVSINKLVEECTTFTLRGSSTKSYFDIANDLWIVDVDEGQINQVIQNLVVNASQAMPNGGNIYVTAKNVTIDNNNPITTKTKLGDYVQISIRDTGVGIPEENISKVFDPYFTTKKTGHGIGLASCFTIIQNHKGYIDVKSELGVGTEFIVLLPRATNNGSQKNPNVDINTSMEKKEIVTGKGKILIMDDEVSILDILQEFLTSLGYEVCVFKDSESALKTFKSHLEQTPFDIAILDFTIPGGMGGIELNKHLLQLDPNLKSILSTGHIDNQATFDFEKYGFCDIMIKPYKIDDISRVVQQALSSKNIN